MTVYVHFLGYSQSEGGIVEILTNENFDMGSVDIENMEQEFDDFKFNCKNTSIFEVKPINNTAWLLNTSVYGGELTEQPTYIRYTGSPSVISNQYIWIENERVKVNGTPTSTACYIDRGVNGSIPISHNLNRQYIDGSNIVMTTKRVSPIGLIVKVYTSEGVILAYGQITELKMVNSSSVEVTCSNLYKQLEMQTVIRPQTSYATVKAAIRLGYNEFFTLLDFNGFSINASFKTEETVDPDFLIIPNMKNSFEQLLNINNNFLSFNKTTGKYVMKDLRRLIGNETPYNLLLSDVLDTNDGVVEVNMSPNYSSIVMDDDEDKITYSSFDSNFTNEYTQGKTINIDVDGLIFDSTNEYDFKSIAKNKLYFLNGILETLSITSTRRHRFFDIGSFYRFNDIFNYPTFYKKITDNVYLCISQDENKVTFLRTLSFVSSLIAPAIIVQKTDTQTYTLTRNDSEFIQTLLYTPTDTLDTMVNPYTGNKLFEIGDEITAYRSDGYVFRYLIGDLDADNFYIDADFGDTDDVFIFSIESNKPFVSLQLKNKAYIYEGESVI